MVSDEPRARKLARLMGPARSVPVLVKTLRAVLTTTTRLFGPAAIAPSGGSAALRRRRDRRGLRGRARRPVRELRSWPAGRASARGRHRSGARQGEGAKTHGRRIGGTSWGAHPTSAAARPKLVGRPRRVSTSAGLKHRVLGTELATCLHEATVVRLRRPGWGTPVSIISLGEGPSSHGVGLGLGLGLGLVSSRSISPSLQPASTCTLLFASAVT